MGPRLFWIADARLRLAIAGRPRGGEWLSDEAKSLRHGGVDVLVSMLTDEEIDELELQGEARICGELGIDLRRYPMADRGLPGDEHAFRSLCRALAADVEAGRGVAVHCRAGIGRSSLLVACILGMCGATTETAFARIAQARGCAVPDTPEQRAWVTEFLRRNSA